MVVDGLISSGFAGFDRLRLLGLIFDRFLGRSV